MKILENYKVELEKDLSEAVSLPFSSYTSEEIYQEELEKVFFDDWVFACHEKEITNKGDYRTIQIGSESVIVMRENDNDICALSNNCRHRGTKLLDSERSHTKKIICPYHNWSYDLSGSLKGAPFSGNVKIDKSSHCLPKYKVEVFFGLVFVNITGNAEPLQQRLGSIAKYFEVFDTKRFKYATETEFEKWKCNWKLAFENGIESYHLFAVHKVTLEQQTPTSKAFYIEGGSEWTLTGGEIKDSKKGLTRLFTGDKYDHLYNYILISLPPSFIGILTYDSLSWLQVLPDGVDSINISSCAITESKAKTPKAITEFTKIFFKEDQDICEKMQISMNSKFAKGGKLVEMEKILVDFRHYLATRIFKSNVSPHFISDKSKIFLG